MKRFFPVVLSLLLCGLCRAQDQSNLSYPSDPDTRQQPGVPQGEVLHFKFEDSRIYPGTQREYWVYVPAQYDPARPACLFFDLDGVQFDAPVVFDNLIHKKEIPVLIGVFVSSGVVSDSTGFPARWNRSYEFDAVNDDFVRFINDELLPDVERRTTSDGRPIRLSKDGKDRAIAGCSSGGIGAFTAAWQRPDLFSRVYSCIGTFVGMRGGDRYPVLIRKTEPKRIRVFLQDGSKDTWNPLFGNWYMGNRDMEAALSFAGYEVGHAWGEGGHDGIQGTAIFPDVMRWLWRGWPAPAGGGLSGNDMLRGVLVAGESWQPADTVCRNVTGLTSDTAGNIFYGCNDTIFRLSADGIRSVYATGIVPSGGLSSSVAGRLLAFDPLSEGLTVIESNGRTTRLHKKIHATGVLPLPHGIYAASGCRGAGSVVLLRPDGSAKTVADGLYEPSAMALSPDHKLLFVADRSSHWIYSFFVGGDGALEHGQRYYWLHTPESSDGGPDRSEACAMAVDRDGNLYVATAMGVQICDRNGRVRLILTLPQGGVTGLCFGGAGFDELYMVCDGGLYRRKVNIPGIQPMAAPVKTSEGGAG